MERLHLVLLVLVGQQALAYPNKKQQRSILESVPGENLKAFPRTGVTMDNPEATTVDPEDTAGTSGVTTSMWFIEPRLRNAASSQVLDNKKKMKQPHIFPKSVQVKKLKDPVRIGNKFLVFSEDKLNWQDARDSCSSQGLRLATIADQPNEVLTYINSNDIYDDEKSYWVGGSDIAVEGTWMWSDGRPFADSFPWRFGEPNNAFADTHGEDCIYASDFYYDWGCHHEIKYICEIVCGQANRGTRIVGGVTTEVNEYPWQVALVGQGSKDVYCGGSLINDRWVLTAAHCTQNGASQVLLGNHLQSQTDSTERRIDVSRVVNHPSYNSQSLDNDFSLLELATPVPDIHPVCLPSSSNPSQYEGVSSVVSGWGLTTHGGSQPDALNEATVTTMSNSQCNQNYGSGVLDSMICATSPGKDSCHGDSGGPLVQNVGGYYNLIGVVSWGYDCADPQYPGVYSRVTHAIGWISSTTSA